MKMMRIMSLEDAAGPIETVVEILEQDQGGPTMTNPNNKKFLFIKQMSTLKTAGVQHQKILKALMQDPENKKCADCRKKGTQD